MGDKLRRRYRLGKTDEGLLGTGETIEVKGSDDGGIVFSVLSPNYPNHKLIIGYHGQNLDLILSDSTPGTGKDDRIEFSDNLSAYRCAGSSFEESKAEKPTAENLSRSLSVLKEKRDINANIHIGDTTIFFGLAGFPPGNKGAIIELPNKLTLNPSSFAPKR